MPLGKTIQITLAWVPAPRQVELLQLRLPAVSTVGDALAAGDLTPSPDTRLGVWGRKVSKDEPLQDGDRVEIYRPLRVDPKHARRQRFNRQGARVAGLFSRRRPGAKPGY